MRYKKSKEKSTKLSLVSHRPVGFTKANLRFTHGRAELVWQRSQWLQSLSETPEVQNASKPDQTSGEVPKSKSCCCTSNHDKACIVKANFSAILDIKRRISVRSKLQTGPPVVFLWFRPRQISEIPKNNLVLFSFQLISCMKQLEGPLPQNALDHSLPSTELILLFFFCILRYEGCVFCVCVMHERDFCNV